MDALLRVYAHSAWSADDPLQALDPQIKLAILLMPSTFSERWRMAPWKSREQRRVAMAEIIAERRLAYEMSSIAFNRVQEPMDRFAAHSAGPGQPGPYHQYRQNLHRRTMDAVADARTSQDEEIVASNPQAAAELAHRKAVRQRWNVIERQSAPLDLDERAVNQSDKTLLERVSPLPSRRRRRDRGR